MTENVIHEQLPIHVESFSRRYGGKILLRSEILLNDDLFKLLLEKKHFQTISPFMVKGWRKQCRRCGNAKRSLLSRFPCGICLQDHLYCRNCIGMGRVSECEPLYIWTGKSPHWPNYQDACTWQGKLTHAQQKAANLIVHAIHMEQKELLIWAVCGSGKTEMLFPGITEALKRGKRVCIATPRADVVRELWPRLNKAFSDIHIQGLYGGSRDRDGTAQLIIATTHQLLRFEKAFDVMIIDEVDAFPFHADPSLPFATDRASKQIHTKIYLTATPRKQQHLQIRRKKLPYVFVPIRFHGHSLPIPQFKMSFSLHKHFPTFLASWLNNRTNERQLLIFVPTIRLAKQLRSNLIPLLLQLGHITSTQELISVHSEDKNREKKIERFRKKQMNMLITTTILERGVTFPSVDVIVYDAGHDVFDEAALVQIAGRAGRSPNDPDGEVIFFHDGKTTAMVAATNSIEAMNRRGGFYD